MICNGVRHREFRGQVLFSGVTTAAYTFFIWFSGYRPTDYQPTWEFAGDDRASWGPEYVEVVIFQSAQVLPMWILRPE